MVVDAAVFRNFSLQLTICEAVFLFGHCKGLRWSGRVPLAALFYIFAGGGWYLLLRLLPSNSRPAHMVFYIGLLALSLISLRFAFSLPASQLLFIGACGYALEHITYAAEKILLFAADYDILNLAGAPRFLLHSLLPYLVVSGAAYIAFVRPNRGAELFKKNDPRMAVLGLIVLIAAIALSTFYSGVQPATELSDVVCPLYSILCCALTIAIEYDIFHQNRLERDKEMMEQMLQMAAQQQKSSKEAIDIINIRCHDLKHQVRALAAISDDHERGEYLADVQRATDIYDMTFHTGHEALDYILREKALLAHEHQVTFSCIADGGAVCFISPADLYALVGNALDNALEAVIREPEEERIISMSISCPGQMVLFHLENRCSREIVFLNGLPVTDKEDTGSHGFGVRSIRYLVEKYGGELAMRTANGTFYMDAVFEQQT